MTPTMCSAIDQSLSKTFKMTKLKPKDGSLYLAIVILLSICCRLTAGQYDRAGGYHGADRGSDGGGYSGGVGGYGGTGGYDGHSSYNGGYGGSYGGPEYEMEPRPKVNLGIRLRIPAFKFELPRFSLPKITVSARIRQPKGPRVITLPEINLDTTGKSELPMKSHGGGGYDQSSGGGYDQHRGPSYQMAPSSYGSSGGGSYGSNYGTDEKTFSFSTEDAKPAHNSYESYHHPATTEGGGYNQPMSQQYQPQQQQPQHQQQIAYSSTDNRPLYSVYLPAPERSPPSMSKSAPPAPAIIPPVTPVEPSSSAHGQDGSKNLDLGFNEPVYMSANRFDLLHPSLLMQVADQLKTPIAHIHEGYE